MSDDFRTRLQQSLNERESAGLLRRRFAMHAIDATHIECDGRTLLNFAGNDYLGLSFHPRVRAAAAEAMARRSGSGAAALLGGYSPIHHQAEKAIARWKGAEAAVLLPSGYQANHAAVQAIAAIGAGRGGVRFLLDKLAHASLIDAVRATGEPYRVFPHNGIDKLRRLLADATADQMQVVVTESIFSMDGDAADLDALEELKREHNFVFLLDEAHASGVYGQDGAGYANEWSTKRRAASLVADRVPAHALVDVSIVTLGKALGCVGGAICGSTALCDAIVNFGRAYVYSTNVPESQAAAAMAAIEVCHDEPGRQARVRALAKIFREKMQAAGWRVPAGDSPIVPLIIESNEELLAASKKLEAAGYFIPAVRPPSVPPGQGRLRITLNAEHTDSEVAGLIESLAAIRRNRH